MTYIPLKAPYLYLDGRGIVVENKPTVVVVEGEGERMEGHRDDRHRDQERRLVRSNGETKKNENTLKYLMIFI